MIVGAGARLKDGAPNARPKRHSHARCRNTLNANHDGHEGTVSLILIKELKMSWSKENFKKLEMKTLSRCWKDMDMPEAAKQRVWNRTMKLIDDLGFDQWTPTMAAAFIFVEAQIGIDERGSGR